MIDQEDCLHNDNTVMSWVLNATIIMLYHTLFVHLTTYDDHGKMTASKA